MPRRGSKAQLLRDIFAQLAPERVGCSEITRRLTKMRAEELKLIAANEDIRAKKIGRPRKQSFVAMIERKRALGWSVERACRSLTGRHCYRMVSSGTLARRYYRAKERYPRIDDLANALDDPNPSGRRIEYVMYLSFDGETETEFYARHPTAHPERVIKLNLFD